MGYTCGRDIGDTWPSQNDTNFQLIIGQTTNLPLTIKHADLVFSFFDSNPFAGDAPTAEDAVFFVIDAAMVTHPAQD